MNLWDPSHVSFTVDLATAFVLGLVHGATPDEHTWPITFSYAVGSYSAGRGLRAGLIFSLAFTAQQAFASELAHLGLAHWFIFDRLDDIVYLVVGAVMAVAGLLVIGRGGLPHLHLWGMGLGHSGEVSPRDLKPWMAAVHGFVAGWGIDAFSIIVLTTLAPAMPSPATGWLPGLCFGIGTLCVQAVAGAAFGWWAARRGLPPEAIRNVALITAGRTLLWGGVAFALFGLCSLAWPGLQSVGIPTGLPIHNLENLGVPFLLLVFTVLGIGITSFVSAAQAWRRRMLAEGAATASVRP